MRRRFEESYIQQGMDPIEARRQSMELINFMIWRESDKYDKHQALIEKYRKENERAVRVDRREKRLIEEGVDPAAARKEAEEEEFNRDPTSARPAPSLLPTWSTRWSSSSRPKRKDLLDPMTVLTGMAWIALLLPALTVVFFLLLVVAVGG